MEITLIYIVLIILSCSVALNLKLTFNLLNIIKYPDQNEPPLLAVEIGDKLPDITGKYLNNENFVLNQLAQPGVFLFLSSKCPKCKEKIPEIERILPIIKKAGLALFLMSNESEKSLSKFLINTSLANLTIKTNNKNYKSINPTLSSPFYLFIDHQHQLQAGGMIGDKNWLSFLEQMAEIQSQFTEAA